ncbi:hypothetical protein B566_EDAN002512 [Ephemera danica]|nr:hypothetical protein B566_EDAN002512 [Ephemera danica]
MWVNNEELHVRVVTEEAKKAMEELKAKDPKVSLKHDPTKVLPTVQAQPKQQVPRVVMYPVDGQLQRMGMNIGMVMNGQNVNIAADGAVFINNRQINPPQWRHPVPPPLGQVQLPDFQYHHYAFHHAGNIAQQVYHNIQPLVNFAAPRPAHIQPINQVNFQHQPPVFVRQVGPGVNLNIQQQPQQQAQWQYRQQRQ